MSDATARPLAAATALAGRGVLLGRRNPDAVISALVMPVMLMLVFVYLFGGAIDTGDTRYVTYVVPGVIVLCAGFGAAGTALSVSEDMRGGTVDRLRTLDVGAVPFLTGHVVATVARNLLATTLVFGVAFLIGFRPSATPAGWLAAIGLLLAYITAVSWLSAAAGLIARTPEAANTVTFLMMFLPYPSSAFVPIDTMPGWLHGFAENQPVTPLIESIRGLLLDQPVGSAPWTALAWCGGLLALAVTVSGALFSLRTR
ncbi:transport permease protein [Streptomyces sp. NE5-10]|uniref:ABC transporter permease n=1 Tax=Streptomyces sp. NE5-10 TaxID=2759674 RepID=UPI001905911F|nr:ABC transporter permease [Streptomyces sp. NE5-10]GHJ97368.1 transport permease protein [Streptomyces sp. NE5-10]